jgi:DNA-binding YbaB/EbfC family protein
MNSPDISQLLKQAQEMQEQMMAAREALNSRVYEGISAGGAVKVVVTGASRVASVEISASVLDDPEMLGDLILVAANQALEAASSDAKEAMGGLTGGLDLGGLFG